MLSFRFKHVRIESFGLNPAPHEVTSAEIEDRIAPVYERLQIPFGTLEKLSGIKTRYFFDRELMPSDLGTVAAENAFARMGIDRKHITALFSCSVTRDYFEPATGCLMHKNLGLPESAIALDVSNACIGFSNGLLFLANLIESGVLKAGVVVSAEQIGKSIESAFAHLVKNPDISRDDLIKILPMFTLGSGAVACVLAHESIATTNHKLLGSVCRTATQHADLCAGNGDYCLRQGDGDFNPIMYTESSELISSAAKLGGRTWPELSETLGWTKDDVDHVFCHQVGRQVNEAFYKELGLDYQKEFTIYRTRGNLISAALPTCFAMGIEEKGISAGEKVVLTAFGSGLNSVFTGIEW